MRESRINIIIKSLLLPPGADRCAGTLPSVSLNRCVISVGGGGMWAWPAAIPARFHPKCIIVVLCRTDTRQVTTDPVNQSHTVSPVFTSSPRSNRSSVGPLYVSWGWKQWAESMPWSGAWPPTCQSDNVDIRKFVSGNSAAALQAGEKAIEEWL